MKKSVLVGMTGSVTTSLAPKIVRAFQKEFDCVEVVMTEKAGAFVDLSSLAVETGVSVYSDGAEWTRADKYGRFRCIHKENEVAFHLELAKRHDALVIVPCSANTVSKMACGIADNLLTLVVLSMPKKPIVVAPSMSVCVWESSIISDNVHALRKRGFSIVPPVGKNLADGDFGVMDTADIKDVIQALKYKFEKS